MFILTHAYLYFLVLVSPLSAEITMRRGFEKAVGGQYLISGKLIYKKTSDKKARIVHSKISPDKENYTVTVAHEAIEEYSGLYNIRSAWHIKTVFDKTYG